MMIFRFFWVQLVFVNSALKILAKNEEELLNFVILFADNLGYDDVSCFKPKEESTQPQQGSQSTPNIDLLASEGKKFLNWNSAAALCSASRAALLTGKYPYRSGVYPGVFKNDATFGLLPEETTLAELLRIEGYATSIVGKWHLGHREQYLPTNQGFDRWDGIPYHMSGGSVDNHTCNTDIEETAWLPLFANTSIVEQPVKLESLAEKYATSATEFIEQQARFGKPFFLYMAFSHVHQLCAPRDFPEQASCQWSKKQGATFDDAIQEMDWITGQILNSISESGASNNTLVLFTSDNGPWVAEKACAGSKGPFKGKWLQEHLEDDECTACPHDYIPSPTSDLPRRCVLPNTAFELEGVPCGEDTGLGSVWEANLRMPAIARLPGVIPANSSTEMLISTLDVLPTFLSFIGKSVPPNLDGIDMSTTFRETTPSYDKNGPERILFFWRDGFQDGPLPQPAGRFDIAAVKLGNIKAWFWTKSAHYNNDVEQYHDPPLLFNTLKDPAESMPLDSSKYASEIHTIKLAAKKHKEDLGWTYPLALNTDPQFLPCVDHENGCRTHKSMDAAIT